MLDAAEPDRQTRHHTVAHQREHVVAVGGVRDAQVRLETLVGFLEVRRAADREPVGLVLSMGADPVSALGDRDSEGATLERFPVLGAPIVGDGGNPVERRGEADDRAAIDGQVGGVPTDQRGRFRC
jgi:hypothetical protein